MATQPMSRSEYHNAGRLRALVADDQTRCGQRAVQRVLQIVIHRVAPEIAGKLAGEEPFEVAKRGVDAIVGLGRRQPHPPLQRVRDRILQDLGELASAVTSVHDAVTQPAQRAASNGMRFMFTLGGNAPRQSRKSATRRKAQSQPPPGWDGSAGFAHVRRLRAFLAFGDFEFHRVAFLQAFIAFR